MTEVEKLRALLAEAREVVQSVLRAANATPYAQWSRDQHQAEIVREHIDAALAEPVEECADCANSFRLAGTRERERDEARAEARELREVLKTAGDRLRACSYELTEHSYQEMASVLFDLPLPEDKR